jgi:hypothetical protein
MAAMVTCEECGSELTGAGHCQKCLFGMAMSSEAAAAPYSPKGPKPWRTLGDYDLYEQIGRGGMEPLPNAPQ